MQPRLAWPSSEPQMPLPRQALEADALEVAPALLGCLLVRDDGRAARIVEVEAYRGADDPGSHAYRGPTPRNEVMFGPAGHLYVYFTYGMHWCANVVCGPEGVASAVLLRAASPLAGTDAMRAARAGTSMPDRDLCRGPARLCRAFGIDGTANGTDVVTGRPFGVSLQPAPDPPGAVEHGPRVGLAPGKGEALPWRFWLADEPSVSPWRPGGRRRSSPQPRSIEGPAGG